MLATSLTILTATLASCSSGQTDHLSGRALLRGADDNAGVTVTAAFAAEDKQNYSVGQSYVTGADGNYHFELLYAPALRCFVTAFAPSTSEKSLSAVVDVSEGGSVTVPDFVFTPIGGAHGVVALAGSTHGNGGTTVALQGTDMTAVTNDAGEYTIMDIPVGSYRLQASHDGYTTAYVDGATIAYAKTTEAPQLTLVPSR